MSEEFTSVNVELKSKSIDEIIEEREEIMLNGDIYEYLPFSEKHLLKIDNGTLKINMESYAPNWSAPEEFLSKAYKRAHKLFINSFESFEELDKQTKQYRLKYLITTCLDPNSESDLSKKTFDYLITELEYRSPETLFMLLCILHNEKIKVSHPLNVFLCSNTINKLLSSKNYKISEQQISNIIKLLSDSVANQY